ncbi:DNA primase [bacterium]|nr:DNA primase [bacterium]
MSSLKIPEEKIDEVREATDIVEVISQYVSLKRRGKSYFGLCPFHQEKTPSFHVDPVRGFYHCFGCGEGGNVFSFVMKMDRVTFPEAVRNLAQKANIEIQITDDDITALQETEMLYQINKMAADFYRECLTKTQAGRRAAEYFTQRGFDSDIAEKFQIGYAPNRWDGLILKARKESIPLENLHKAGLVIPRNDKSGFYDRFRGRLMFPVLNTSGRVVGFGGRALKTGKNIPKYINSPETAIYRKSRILYGLYLSREGIRNEDKVLLVEGYTDLMRLHQRGFPFGAATSGTALTSDQAHLISRYTQNVILVYDGDSAGFAAALRGADILFSEGLYVQVAALPSGSDPDAFLRDKGTEALRKLLSNAKTIVEFQLSMKRQEKKLGTAADKSRIATELLVTIRKIKDPVERQLMVRELAEKLGIEERLLHQKLRRMIKHEKETSGVPGISLETARDKAEKALIQMLLKEEGCWAGPIFSQIGPEDFRIPVNRRLAEIVQKHRENGTVFNHKDLLHQLDREPEVYQSAVSLISSVSLNDMDLYQLGLDCVLFVKEERLKQDLQAVKDEMRKYQKDESRIEVLRNRWQDLYQEKRALITNITASWKKMVENL